MRNKFLVNVTAIATAFTMVAAPSITAFATEGGESLTESTSEPATTTQNSANPENVVNSDIIITNGNAAVTATEPSTSITVNGNIDQKNESMPDDSSYVPTVAAIIASNGTTTHVTGNVVAAYEGLSATDGANVTIDGNINATGVKTECTYYDEDGKPITTEYMYRSMGISTINGTNITVGGTVDSWESGVTISLKDNAGAGSIVIGDSITSTNGPGIYISNMNSTDSEGNLITAYLTEDHAKAAIPAITVFEVNGTGNAIRTYVEDSKNHPIASLQNYVENAINYIIKKDEGITFSDDASVLRADENNQYDTIKQGNTFSVNATINPGYYLYAGKNVNVDDNHDGTYTLTFHNNTVNSKGGIYIRALLIPTSTTTSEGESKPESYTVVVQEAAPELLPSNPVNNGAIVVSNTTTAADTSSAIAAISGTKPARTVSYNIANVTPAQYKASVIENVAAAPANGAFNIETDRVSCFDRNMIEAIASRPDIDVNVVFTYGGKKLKVTIPAGYNVRTLLDEGGYCGFLRLMALLGATELS